MFLWADGPPNTVHWDFFFLFLVVKMTLKTQKIWGKNDVFATKRKKDFGKYPDLFSKVFSQNFKIFIKKQLILQDLGKI